MARLRDDQVELLEEVLQARAPDRVELLRKARESTLLDVEREELCEVISAEFSLSGLDEDYEPTRRGMLLEELLDVINRPRLRR